MAKQTGLGDHLLVDSFDISGDIGSVQRIAGGPAALDLTDITEAAYERVGGERNGGIDFNSWFNKAAGRAHPVLSTLPTANRVVSYAKGYVLGNAVASCVAKQIGYDGTRDNAGNFSLATSTQSNGFGLEWGRQLTPGVRTDTGSANGGGLDGAASSSFGLQAYLHVLAFTGTSVVIKLMDSPDNTGPSYTDITGAVFATVTGVGSQRISISNAAAVQRWVRVSTNGTFSNLQFFVNFVRNETAVVF